MAETTKRKFSTKTSHVVILFLKSNKEGKKFVDVLSTSWILFEGDDIYCFYPPRSKYVTVEEMSKVSAKPSYNWRKYKI